MHHTNITNPVIGSSNRFTYICGCIIQIQKGAVYGYGAAIAAAAAKTVEIVTKMIACGKLSLEEIAEYSGLPLDEIKALAEKNKSAAT